MFKKHTTPLLIVAFIGIGLLVWQLGLVDKAGQPGNNLQSNLSTHQTGKAFEVIEPPATNNDYSGKTEGEFMPYGVQG